MQRDTNYILSVFSAVALLLLTSSNSIGQDTSATWMYDIDPTEFKVSKRIADIPKQFYDVMSICCKHDIVVNPEDFKKSCVGPGITRKLNWVAKGKNRRWVISVSYGGRAYYTTYYFFDFDNGKMNINGFHFAGRDNLEMAFDRMVPLMREKGIRADLDFEYKYDNNCKEHVKYHEMRNKKTAPNNR